MSNRANPERESRIIPEQLRWDVERCSLKRPENYSRKNLPPGQAVLKFYYKWKVSVLVQTTYVENFETGNIQYADEVLPLLLGVEGLVTLLDQILEHPVEHRLGHGAHRVVDLVHVTALGDELVADLDPGLQEGGVQSLTIHAQEFSYTLTILKTVKKLDRNRPKKRFLNSYFCAVSFSLFFATPLLELHATHVHNGGGDLVDVVLLLLGEAQDVEGLLHGESLALKREEFCCDQNLLVASVVELSSVVEWLSSCNASPLCNY